MKLIGSGTHSKVFQLDEKRIIKVFKTEHIYRALITYLIARIVKNKYILSVEKMGVKAPFAYLIQPKAEWDLATHIRNNLLTRDQIITIMYQLLIGLNRLHHRGIIHADIKPSNIMVMKDNTFCINDFSLSILFEKKINYVCATCNYRPPEVFMGKSWNHKVDIWSLGCCFYELCFGRTLFDCQEDKNMLSSFYDWKEFITHQRLAKFSRIDWIRPHISPTFNSADPIHNLIIQMLNNNADLRPNTEELLANSIFVSFSPISKVTSGRREINRPNLYQSLSSTSIVYLPIETKNWVISCMIQLLLYHRSPIKIGDPKYFTLLTGLLIWISKLEWT